MKRAEQAALWFFAAGTLLTLGVSLPATYAALALFHDAGGWGGWVLDEVARLRAALDVAGRCIKELDGYGKPRPTSPSVETVLSALRAALETQP